MTVGSKLECNPGHHCAGIHRCLSQLHTGTFIDHNVNGIHPPHRRPLVVKELSDIGEYLKAIFCPIQLLLVLRE